MKKYCFIYLALLFLCGCGTSGFLNDETINSFYALSSGENHTVYLKQTCTIDEKGRIVETTHQIIKLSEDIKNRMQSLSFQPGSMYELTAFKARLINKDGSAETYGMGDLLLRNTSSSQVIHESTSYSLPLGDKNQEGDFVEFIYSLQSELSPLGYTFSPAEAGHAAENVCLEIVVPKNFRLSYKSVNCNTKPAVASSENNTSYLFRWDYYRSKGSTNPFEKLNNEPEILASFSFSNEDTLNSWRAFGNWYLNEIKDKVQPNDEIKALAGELTKGIKDPKEKLDQIFNYCQKNIRYEQVYLRGGEFIPNECPQILKRKFGDCKDYSAIIYTLAKCAGVDAHIALCRRGRGVEFYDIPASQFNHAIVHYSYNGKDYWYDGTNRISEPGLTTFDLANQMALVIEKDNSRIVKISENEGNLFSITGMLSEAGDGFLADLKLSFAKQYAIDFLYPDIFLNRTDMKDYITRWVKDNLSANFAVSEVKWTKASNGSFEISLKGKLPNAFTRIAPACYTSIGKIFPELFYNGTIEKNDELFYYPKFNRINIMLKIPGMQKAEENGGSLEAEIKYSCLIPLGPFLTKDERNDFIEKYNGTYSDIHKKLKLTNRTAK